MIVVLGELAIGDLIPLPASLLLAAQLDLTTQQQALKLQITLPQITIAAQIGMLLDMITNLQLCLALGIKPPSINAQLDILAAILALINVKLAGFLRLSAAMTNGGVFAYQFSGPTNQAGPELTAELAGGFPGAGPGTHADMLIFGTILPATWEGMQVVFKTTP